MVRLFVIVEGQTEESFVNHVLGPELTNRGFQVSAKIMGNARQRSRRGGIRPWPGIKAELLRHLRRDNHLVVTTMVDYYGLPRTGAGAWPNDSLGAGAGVEDLASAVEAGMAEQISLEMGGSFDPTRFVPFVVMHEFEAILFSDCYAFCNGIYRPDLEADLRAVRDSFNTPEEIDDHPETHPSKRIEVLYPDYEKPLHGTLAALEVGLDSIRAECPHFAHWLRRLEAHS